MAIVNFIAEKWSALVELIAQEASIARRVTGGQYQMDAAGTSIIHTATVNDVTIGDYTGADITVAALADTGVDIPVDQKKYFAFSVDDVDAAQSAANFKDPAIIQAAKKLGLEADKKAFSLYADATIPAGNKLGTLAVPIAITNLNVDTYFFDAKEILDTQNAGDDRWAVVPPWMMNKLNDAGLGIQLSENLKDDMFKNAEIIRFAGFNIMKSNSLTIDPTASGYQCLFYTSRAIVLVDQIQKVKAFDIEKKFAEGVKGLYVFGCAVKFGKEVVVLSAIKG
jgi:hypothetical protein